MAIPQASLKNLPQSPGVYIFKDRQGIVLYVGKAINLSRRVKQYFSGRDAIGEKTRVLVSQIALIETHTVPSEFDALLLEASLIRKFMPKYNVISRDDKSPLYIVITLDEPLPRVVFLRKSDLPKEVPRKRAIFGPFQSGRTARALMRTLRRIVPYCLEKQRTGRPCFYTHLGLCDPCPSVIANMPNGWEKKQNIVLYMRHMRELRDILSGKSTMVLRAMDKEMRGLAQDGNFEKAAHIKRQIQGLYDLITRKFDLSAYVTNVHFMEELESEELGSLLALLQEYFPNLTKLERIECIDIANIAGREATGSLVVLTRGIPDNSEYRRFRIRMPHVPNDVAMISEVVTRRLKHSEWPYPDLLVVDGGKPQVRAAMEALTVSLPIIGLAKRLEEIVLLKDGKFRTIQLPLTNPAIHILQKIRDEAHRFARRYHHLLRTKRLFDTISG